MAKSSGEATAVGFLFNVGVMAGGLLAGALPWWAVAAGGLVLAASMLYSFMRSDDAPS